MKWINHDIDERRVMLQQVANHKGISLNAVEKDWWVTMTLKALFNTSFAPYLLFKGGTSLSKGWNIINRFSEDIDISLGRDWFFQQGLAYAACENKSQRERLRKKSRQVIITDLLRELHEQLCNHGLKEDDFFIDDVSEVRTNEGVVPVSSDKDPTVLNVIYKSILEESTGYIQPLVKIEISCLNLSEPFEPRPITTMISELFPEADDETTCTINTVSPERTFLEKAFLLNEEFQKEDPRTRRMSRHYYDLEKLMDTEFGIKALTDYELYNRIIEHRRKYNALRYVNYDLNRSDKIWIIPPADLLSAFDRDYEEMQESMVFKDAIPFEDLILRMHELQERIRKIQ